jgi:periplasmic protein TonB
MYNDQDRALHYAVLCSIVLHGVLLFGLSAPRNPENRASAPGPIVARLVQPAPSAAPVAAPRPEPVKPNVQEKPPAPSAVKRVPAVKPRPLAKSEAKAPARAAPAPSTPVTEPVAEAPPSPPAPSAAPAPAGPPATAIARVDPTPAPAPPGAEAFDAGSLAQYRLQVISAARKYKRYPRAAMDNNWEGDVVVRMVIGANGMISALSVKSSSGHQVLDQQALEMFKRAKPLVQIPPALRGREFTIELRAIYSLKDQESS